MMELVYIYILIGLIGGVTAGMLGLGGGIIFVPGLLLVHKFSGLFDGYQLQSAVYTSLICIIFAGSTSSYLHFKNKLIEFKFVKKYAVFVSLGCLLGIYLLEQLSSKMLENIYGLILIVLALLLISDAKIIRNNMIIVRNVGKFYFFLNGTISSLMGIGGGTLSVPYISFLIDDIKKSIATASALGLVIATTSIIFMYMINLEIFYSKINHLSLFLIIPASIVGSYIGVTLLNKIDPDKVKKIFSGLLIIIAMYIFID